MGCGGQIDRSGFAQALQHLIDAKVHGIIGGDSTRQRCARSVALGKTVPLGRPAGPEDIADVLLFLARRPLPVRLRSSRSTAVRPVPGRVRRVGEGIGSPGANGTGGRCWDEDRETAK